MHLKKDYKLSKIAVHLDEAATEESLSAERSPLTAENFMTVYSRPLEQILRYLDVHSLTNYVTAVREQPNLLDELDACMKIRRRINPWDLLSSTLPPAGTREETCSKSLFEAQRLRAIANNDIEQFTTRRSVCICWYCFPFDESDI